MIMDNNWLEKAVSRYETCNYKTLNWILSRSPLIEGFLNTKVNSITGISYTNYSGTRGPKFIYGWIPQKSEILAKLYIMTIVLSTH